MLTTDCGIGRPIRPAFSMMLITSLDKKPMTTASRMNVVPSMMSSRAAINTIASVIPFRTRPFQPALLSRPPFSVFFEA